MQLNQLIAGERCEQREREREKQRGKSRVLKHTCTYIWMEDTDRVDLGWKPEGRNGRESEYWTGYECE
jgi:hypothetical protein